MHQYAMPVVSVAPLLAIMIIIINIITMAIIIVR